MLPIAALAAMAQTPAAPLAFEVATIKLAEPITPAMVQAGKMHAGMSMDAARVDIGYVSLYDLLATAFKVKPYQVEGPDWIRVQRFDILAKMPPGATKDDVPVMLQGLLKERFKLEFHRGTKEHPIYALVVAPGGLKMKEAEPDVPVDPAAEPKPLAKGEMAFGSGENAVRLKQGADGTSGTAQTAKVGAVKFSMSPDGVMHYEYEKLEMSLLADASVAVLRQARNRYDRAQRQVSCRSRYVARGFVGRSSSERRQHTGRGYAGRWRRRHARRGRIRPRQQHDFHRGETARPQARFAQGAG